MDDQIYRQATIDAMEEVDWYHINKDGQLTHGANSREDEPLYKAKDVYKVLNDMPSARSDLSDYSDKLWRAAYERGKAEAQRWIPCTPETMPKKTDYYLVQYTRKYCRDEMAVAFYSVEEARCDDDYTWEIETFSDIKEVIAWKPLPEPYRVDEEGDE